MSGFSQTAVYPTFFHRITEFTPHQGFYTASEPYPWPFHALSEVTDIPIFARPLEKVCEVLKEGERRHRDPLRPSYLDHADHQAQERTPEYNFQLGLPG